VANLKVNLQGAFLHLKEGLLMGIFNISVLGLLTLVVVQIQARPLCQFNQEDFSQYLVAKQQISIWLLDAITKEKTGILASVDSAKARPSVKKPISTKTPIEVFNEFEGYLRSGSGEFSTLLQLKSFGLKKGLPNQVVNDLILIIKIEKLIPEIDKTEKACEDMDSVKCRESINIVLKKFNLFEKKESKLKSTEIKKHCEI
jgi:hypothetical protein